MPPQQRLVYEFSCFQLDPDGGILFKDGKRVSLTRREFSVLLVLVESNGRVTKKNDLISRVWGDTFVEENNLNVQIANLRKKLGPDEQYIETVPGVGYKFTPDVTQSTYRPFGTKTNRTITRRTVPILLSIPIVLFAVSVGVRKYQEARVRTVIDEAVLKEFSFYKNPELFTKDQLKDYWILPEHGGTAASKIEEGVQRLIRDGRVYGQETTRELFEVQRVSVSLFGFGNRAEIVIREVWYMPNYDKTGRQLPTKIRQEFVEEKYTMHKVSGQWLISSTSATYKK